MSVALPPGDAMTPPLGRMPRVGRTFMLPYFDHVFSQDKNCLHCEEFRCLAMDSSDRAVAISRRQWYGLLMAAGVGIATYFAWDFLAGMTTPEKKKRDPSQPKGRPRTPMRQSSNGRVRPGSAARGRPPLPPATPGVPEEEDPVATLEESEGGVTESSSTVSTPAETPEPVRARSPRPHSAPRVSQASSLQAEEEQESRGGAESHIFRPCIRHTRTEGMHVSHNDSERRLKKRGQVSRPYHSWLTLCMAIADLCDAAS